jgi:predicted ATPase
MEENKLYVTRISLKDNISSKEFETYPLNINALRFFEALRISSPVTIFFGENGCGKSTLIEAIADIFDVPTAGGNRNMGAFVDTNLVKGKENAPLSKYLYVAKSHLRPNNTYFFRAESFHELSTLIDEDSRRDGSNAYLNTENYCSKDLLEQSHGQSFIDLIEHQFRRPGLYILDEPESALSPSSQLKLLKLIHKLSKEGSQFIIATHSPILLGYKYATLVNLDDGMRIMDYKDTKIYRIYNEFMKDPDEYQEYLFEGE